MTEHGTDCTDGAADPIEDDGVTPDDRRGPSAEAAIAEFGIRNDLRTDAAQALLLLGELRYLTRWDDETLCRRLGCDPSDWTQVGGGPARERAVLRHSLAFLELVRDVTRLVDLTGDRRRVLNGTFELCASMGGPAADPVPRIREALQRAPEGGLSSWDLLGLGEIGRAWRAAALNLDGGPAHERAVATARVTEPLSARTGHLTPRRLAALAAPDPAETLGPEVCKRMRLHVAECAKCRRVAADVAPQLLVEGALKRPAA